ncbi:MAG: TonB-dependent receptor [Janthinobacterium lividum]
MTMFAAPFAVSFSLQAYAQSAPASAPAVTGAAPASANRTNGDVASDNALPTVQVTGAPERPGFQTPKSSVGAKVATDPHDIAQTTTSVNKALLQSEGVTSFADALRNVPGVTLGAAEGGTIGNNVNLRGFTARTDIYLDGFRDRGQYYRDTFDLESIDVLYGPSSLYFGRGSTGGVINQVSKKPNLTPSGEVSTTVGTHDHYRASFDINHPLNDTSAFRIDGFGQDIGSTRDVLKNKDYGFAPSVRFGIGTPTEITLSALIQHNHDQADYGSPPLNGQPAATGRSTLYGFTSDHTDQDVQTFSARIQHRFNDIVTVRNQTQFSHYGTSARETNPQSVLTGPLATSPALTSGNFTALSASQLFVKLASKDRDINDHSVYNSTDVEAKFGAGWLKNDVIGGVDLSHETYANQSLTSTGPGLPSGTLAIVSLVDPAVNARTPGTTTVRGNLVQSSANGIGAYVNDTMSLGPQWKLVGGVRWDRYSASINNSISVPGSASQTNFFTSTRGGVIYQPADWQSYYVSYGTSFDPSLEALTLTNKQQNLPPESNKSYEIGSKWDFLEGNLSVAQSLFQIEKDNARTLTATGDYTLDGDVKVKGYQIGAAGRITKKWQVFGGYTYLDSKVIKAADGTQGNTLANTPKHMFTLWTTYAITPVWEIGGGPVYMSSRYAANTNLVKVGGYTRWDAMAAFHQKKYDVQLNVINLTNKNYWDALIPSDGGRAVPGFGRTFLATLNYRY